MHTTRLVLAAAAAAAAAFLAPVHGAGPSFVPDLRVDGSTLDRWTPLGQATWTADNGEIVGTPSAEAGGWLVFDTSWQDTGFFATFRCDAGCRTGVLLRADPPRVQVAGRTDAGVHARGQVAHVDLPPDVAADRLLLRRFNGLLPPDVRVRRVSVAPDGFDARFSALSRTYRYRVADGPEHADPLRRHDVLTWRPLDLALLRAACPPLLGEHDFAAFCKQREGATTIRTLTDLMWTREPDGLLVAHVRADAFCHSMVRSLVGCLLAVGDGRRDAAWAGEVLRAGVRDPAVAVVHAHGLTLEEVNDTLAELLRRQPVPDRGDDDGADEPPFTW